MEPAEFEALVSRMERLAADRPAAYRRRVFGLAFLGYGYLALVVLVLLALCALTLASLKAAALAARLFFVVGATLILVLRAMWVKMTPPSGERLTRGLSPELFQLLDRLYERLQAPPLHEIVLTPDFNAGVMQVPRLGLFGWHRSYLCIGLPLMKALSVEQFRAVLAHELGHLSRGHARATNWIYRLRLIWVRLEAAFSQSPQWGSGLIRTFFKWYIPLFSATSFPLARANEYEADAASVRLTSARSAAQTLTAVNIVGSYLSEKYWPKIQAAAKDCPQPADAPFRDFGVAALQAVPEEQLRGWQDAALAKKTSHADTHPSLTDRLQAIGAAAEFAPPASEQSAERLLGAERIRMEAALDAQWRERVADSWRKFYETTQRNRFRIAELRSEAAQAELAEPKALELANLEESVGARPATALAMRRSLVEKYPESLPARFALARQQLQSGEAEGVAPMESVIAKQPESVPAGAVLLRDYFWKRGEGSLAAQWNTRLVEGLKVLQAAQQERAQFRQSDGVSPHRLSPEPLAKLIAQLKVVPVLRRAYLVRKVTRHFPEQPMYVLGFKSGNWWALSNRAGAKVVAQRIREQVRFPGSALIVNLEASSSRFPTKLRRVKGSRVV
jgi:Zn-dependent protease with chaperone function